MKITPSNQTLILATERRGAGASPGGASPKTSSQGAVLQRVTIVASQPDSTVVYLRADYATPGGGGGSNGAAERPDADFAESFTGGAASWVSSSPAGQTATRAASASSALVVDAPSGHPLRDGYGNTLSNRRDAAISSYLPPAEQYAQTQRLGGITPTVPHIDVHA